MQFGEVGVPPQSVLKGRRSFYGKELRPFAKV